MEIEPAASTKPLSLLRSSWTIVFLLNVFVGYLCYFSGVNLINQFRSASVESPDLSDFLVKFSIIYLLIRYQLLLKTFSDTLPGLILAFVSSVMVNLLVGDLIAVLVWHPFCKLLYSTCSVLATYIERKHKATYTMMGLSYWLKFTAAKQMKYAVAYYLLYRTVKSLVKSGGFPTRKKESRTELGVVSLVVPPITSRTVRGRSRSRTSRSRRDRR